MISSSQGINASERYLSLLCKRTFLSLWSFSNLFRQKGSELCDLLVVCGDDIIIFSDKLCQYPNTGNNDLNWSRWFNRGVIKSAKQLWGAENWIKRTPSRVYLESTCENGLRVSIQITDRTRFHLILVAHGASDACFQMYGGSGSLILDNRVKGFVNHNQPFVLGDLDEKQSFIHVLDDNSLDILLQNRDTITDFTNYLEKREQFLRSGLSVYSPGEEELLAYYLKEINEKGEHDFVMPKTETEGYAFAEGTWDEFVTNEQRIKQIAADEVSYFWDFIIERFNYHTINDSQYYVSEGGYSDGEKIIRFLAKESRFNRRVFAESLRDMILNTSKHLRRIRVMPAFRNNLYYVVLLFPYDPKLYESDYDQYRIFRRFQLTCTVYLVRLLNPNAEHIVGIAMESGIQPTASSEDLIYFDCSGWDEELEKQTIADQKQFGILLSPKRFEIDVKEYPN